MLLVRQLRNRIGNARFFSTAGPPAVPTAQELALNEENIAAFRRLQYTSVTPKFMGQDLVPPAKYVEKPKNVGDIQALSGVPTEQSARTVVIGPRKFKTVSSGSRFATQWTIQWKAEHQRWSNPLMGWTSSSDPMGGIKLHFDTRENAIAYAQRQGWHYEELAANSLPSDSINRYPMRTYADNFLPRVTMQRVAEQGGAKSPEFNNFKYGNSHWHPYLNYHGTAPARQHGNQKAE